MNKLWMAIIAQVVGAVVALVVAAVEGTAVVGAAVVGTAVVKAAVVGTAVVKTALDLNINLIFYLFPGLFKWCMVVYHRLTRKSLNTDNGISHSKKIVNTK